MEDRVCGFSQLSLMKEAFSLQRIFYAAEHKFENEETIIFFSAPQMICNGMLAKIFHFRTQENDFYWILMGWFKKSPASAGCLQPCNKAYHKVCQHFSYTRALLCRITCKEDWFVPMLSCTQKRQMCGMLCCPCQLCTRLALNGELALVRSQAFLQGSGGEVFL